MTTPVCAVCSKTLTEAQQKEGNRFCSQQCHGRSRRKSPDEIRERKRRNDREYARRKRNEPLPKVGPAEWSTPENLSDEKETPEVWAERVWAGLDDYDRRIVALALGVQKEAA